MTEIRMPKPGEAIQEAILGEIVVADGELATEGSELYVVETDKVALSIDAPASGIMRWQAEEGETYPVGHLLGVIE